VYLRTNFIIRNIAGKVLTMAIGETLKAIGTVDQPDPDDEDQLIGQIVLWADNNHSVKLVQAIDIAGNKRYFKGGMMVNQQGVDQWLIARRQRILERRQRCARLYCIAFGRYLDISSANNRMWTKESQKAHDQRLRFKSRLVRLCNGSPVTAEQYYHVLPEYRALTA
jgi:hypothetical protein